MLADRAPEPGGRDQVENRMKLVTQKAIEQESKRLEFGSPSGAAVVVKSIVHGSKAGLKLNLNLLTEKDISPSNLISK